MNSDAALVRDVAVSLAGQEIGAWSDFGRRVGPQAIIEFKLIDAAALVIPSECDVRFQFVAFGVEHADLDQLTVLAHPLPVGIPRGRLRLCADHEVYSDRRSNSTQCLAGGLRSKDAVRRTAT